MTGFALSVESPKVISKKFEGSRSRHENILMRSGDVKVS
jgi:hypothetical protein